MKVVGKPEPVARAPQSTGEPEPPMLRTPIDVRSAAFTVIAVVLAVAALQYAQAMLIPIVVGVLISYALDPVVTALGRARVPRPLASALVLMLVVGASAGLLYGISGQVSDIVEQMPKAARHLRERFENRPRSGGPIAQVQKAATELEKAATAAAPASAPPGVTRVQVESRPFNIGEYLMSGSVGAATIAGQILLVLFLVYFLLASGDLYRRKLVKIAGPSLSKKKVTLQILSEIDRQIERFLLVQLFTSTVVGVVTWLAFRAMGLHEAAVWGLLAGVFNSIPYFGPVLVGGGTAIVAFLQFDDIRMALLISGTSFVITSLEGFVLTPWLTSRAARMNAVAVFVNLLFWSWVWEVWGMLLAVPMLMVVKAVCDQVDDFKPIGELIGE